MSVDRVPNQELHLTEKGREVVFSDLSAVLANLTKGVLIFGPEGHLLAANQAALEVHGYERIEDFSLDPNDFSGELEVQDLKGQKLPLEMWPVSRAVRGERFSSQEVQIRRLRDGTRWVGRYGGTPVRDENGQIKQVVLTVRNITDEVEAQRLLKEAEERAQHLARASEELASSLDYEETLQKVADSMVPWFARWCAVTLGEDPPDLKQVAVAHARPEKVEWARRLNEVYPPDSEAGGGTPNVVRTGQVEFYPQVTDEMLEAVAQDEKHLELLREVGFRSVIIVPMRARGRTVGALTFVGTEEDCPYDERDVQFARELAARAALAVDNARLYREALDAKEAAEAASRAKSAFLANMSHEIRTPLTTVTGFLPLLEDGPEEDRKKYLELIQAGAGRLKEMLESIMTLARLEAGKSDLALEQVHVVEEAEEVTRLMETKASRKGLRLRFVKEHHGSPLVALLDPGAVTSILGNLISNAIKFTSEGRITVTVGASDGQAFVRVEDTGPGIDEAFLGHLFDPFEQESTGMGRVHEGSGLGLAIAKQLVEAMSGEIKVESVKGEGTTFTVWFPLVDVSPSAGRSDEKGSAPVSLASLPVQAVGKKWRILVVEDNPEIQMLIASLLGDACSLAVAETAEDAIHRAEQTAYDLVLMDIHLKGKGNGVHVLKRLREKKGYEQVPMVAMTAYALPGDREQFMRSGFDGYVAKPFSPGELMSLVGRLLGEEQSSRTDG